MPDDTQDVPVNVDLNVDCDDDFIPVEDRSDPITELLDQGRARTREILGIRVGEAELCQWHRHFDGDPCNEACDSGTSFCSGHLAHARYRHAAESEREGR